VTTLFNPYQEQRRKTEQFFHHVYEQFSPKNIEGLEQKVLENVVKRADKIKDHLLAIDFIRAQIEETEDPKVRKKAEREIERREGKIEKHKGELEQLVCTIEPC